MPNPAYKTEDKVIMQYVNYLELFWRVELTTSQQDAWMTRWTGRPPQDIKLKKYVPYTPTALDQVKVTPQRAYAWSQIFGYQRYHRAPIKDCAPLGDNTVTLSNFDPKVDHIRITYAIVPELSPPIPFIIWIASQQFVFNPAAMGGHKGNAGLGRNGLRPMCFNTVSSSTGTLDAIDCFKLRAQADPAFAMSISAGYVNDNNELVPSHDLFTRGLID
jgi:hypothetical protein